MIEEDDDLAVAYEVSTALQWQCGFPCGFMAAYLNLTLLQINGRLEVYIGNTIKIMLEDRKGKRVKYRHVD